MEFREAIESLAQAAGMELPAEEADATPQIDHQKPLYESMEKATRLYESLLRKHPTRGVLSTTLNNAVYQVRSPETFDWVLRLKGGITS